MSLNNEEIGKINTLFKQLDEKDSQINSLRSELENYRGIVTEMNTKLDTLIEALGEKKTAKAK